MRHAAFKFVRLNDEGGVFHSSHSMHLSQTLRAVVQKCWVNSLFLLFEKDVVSQSEKMEIWICAAAFLRDLPKEVSSEFCSDNHISQLCFIVCAE